MNPFPLHSRALLAFAYQKPHSSTLALALGRNVRPEIDIRVPDGRWSKEDVDAKILYTFGDCVLFSSRTEQMPTLYVKVMTRAGAGEELPVASVVYRVRWRMR